MIRQAHSYFAGAVSGTVLIAVAVVAFVLLVSAQAFRDWPLSGLGGGDQSVSIGPGKPAAGGRPTTAPATAPNAATVDGHRAQAAPVVRLQQNSTSAEAPGSTASPHHGNSGTSVSGSGSTPTDPSSGSGTGGNGGSGSNQPGAGIESPSGTVNDAVSQVDETVGGALNETQVPEATQGALDGVAGPHSPIGNAVGTIDETVDTVHDTVGAVDGLLGPHR